MKWLKVHGSAHSWILTGKGPFPMKAMTRVKNFFTENNRSHIRECSKMDTFKPHKFQVLSPAKKLARESACEFWLIFPELGFERVIRADEKWFVLRSVPHSQNDRYTSTAVWSGWMQESARRKNYGMGEQCLLALSSSSVIRWFNDYSDVYLDCSKYTSAVQFEELYGQR